jgi:hypothetical protein
VPAYLYAVLKGDVTLDHLGRLLGLWIIPRGVLFHLAVNGDVIVFRLAFPGAGILAVSVAQKLPLDGIGREVYIALQSDVIFALGKLGFIPGCFRNLKLLG